MEASGEPAEVDGEDLIVASDALPPPSSRGIGQARASATRLLWR